MNPAGVLNAATTAARLDARVLLGIYLILPASIILVASDIGLNNSAIVDRLPEDPHSMQWFSLFFMLPHIFASTFTLADKDYIKTYGRRIAASTLAIIMGVYGLLAIAGEAAFAIFISVYTVYHLVSQQAGIAAMIGRHKSNEYETWRWSMFVIIAILYVAMLTDSRLAGALAIAGTLIFLPIVLATGWKLSRQCRTPLGYRYVHANTIMTTACAGFYFLDMPFFAVLIPRVIHDLSAFYFYSIHNRNRNIGAPRNLFVRITSIARIPATISTPITGIAATAIATTALGNHPKAMFLLMAFLSLFHYYWESIIWKSGTVHRQYVRI